MTDASPAAAAWERLLESLRVAAAVVEGPIGAKDERERAEGYRHLTRLLSVGTEMWIEKGDPARPEFTRWMTPHRKLLGDSPETYYDYAPVTPGRAYRLAGNRGSSHYLGIVVYGTGEGGARSIVSSIDDIDLQIDGDGTFEVVVSSTRPEGVRNWIELVDPATDIMVRQYFLHPADEVDGVYELLVDPPVEAPAPLDEQTIARRLDALGAYVTEIIEVEASLSALMAMATPGLLRAGSTYTDAQGQAAPPPVDPAVVSKAMPTPAIQYTGQWFDDLGDDEMMVVHGVMPDARFFSVQVLSRWMESPDYLHHRCFLTSRDLTVDTDGRFEVSIAHRNPGVGDWLDTAGLRSASIAVRALHASGSMEVAFDRRPIPSSAG